jgi:hypothetical protein
LGAGDEIIDTEWMKDKISVCHNNVVCPPLKCQTNPLIPRPREIIPIIRLNVSELFPEPSEIGFRAKSINHRECIEWIPRLHRCEHLSGKPQMTFR